MSNVVIPVIVGAVCAAVFAVLGFVLGVAHRRKTAEKEIGSATQEATKIINNALAEAEASKKEKVLEAKDEVHKLRSDADRDIRERRNEVQRQEKRLNQREEYLDKKADSLEAKNDKISEKQKELENKLLEVDGIKKSQFDMLERISGLTQEEAKNQLLASLEEELDTEIAVGDLIGTLEYDYPAFHLSMDCFWCEVVSGDLVLKEAEAARWLTKEEFDSVPWLPADQTILDVIRSSMQPVKPLHTSEYDNEPLQRC